MNAANIITPSITTPASAAPKTVKVSIIIPVYNEYYHVAHVIDRVLTAPMPPEVEKEVIVIDDGSTDGTTGILQGLGQNVIKVHHSILNFGKGTAIRIGLKHATGDVIVIQDGDTEYNPDEIASLIAPILTGQAKVVYGSRFLGKVDGMYFKYWLANRILVWMVRLLYASSITDEATAYKAFDAGLIQGLTLRCRRFEFCPEVTAKILSRGHRIHEVPITYSARTVAQGKKIRFRDALEAAWTLVYYRFFK